MIVSVRSNFNACVFQSQSRTAYLTGGCRESLRDLRSITARDSLATLYCRFINRSQYEQGKSHVLLDRFLKSSGLTARE
jgi:hypothetical protein